MYTAKDDKARNSSENTQHGIFASYKTRVILGGWGVAVRSSLRAYPTKEITLKIQTTHIILAK